MNKVIFFGFISAICTYLWADKYNREQKQDFNNKIHHYQQQAEQENLEAKKALAHLYASGVRLAFFKNYGINPQKSAYWYEQAAKQGDMDCQFAIANIYENGIGIQVNLQNANYWYYQASLQGDSLSQYRLAKNFENGNGITQSYQDAMYWYLKLAEQGNREAIYKVGVVYDDGLWGFAENNELALFWLNKLDPNNKNSPFDLRSRLIILKNPIDLSKVQVNQIQIPQQQYANTNKYYSSEHYGYSKEPTAQCWDGTYSYSLGRRGVCSGHGGVKYWF